MSAEQVTQPADTSKDRSAAEAWVERAASFWGRALVDAVRLVFSMPKPEAKADEEVA